MTTILVILCVLLSVTVALLIYLVKLCQNKIDIYEEWVLEFRDDVRNVYNALKSIDDRQIFEKDDEVGVVFEDLVTLITKLNERTISDVKNQDTKEENS